MRHIGETHGFEDFYLVIITQGPDFKLIVNVFVCLLLLQVKNKLDAFSLFEILIGLAHFPKFLILLF